MKALIFAMGAIAGLALGQAAMAQSTAAPTQVAHGQHLFGYWCATCHGPGIGLEGAPHLPGTGALMAKYKGAKPALLSERTDLTPDLVRYFVRNGVSIMPFFRKTEISDGDLADIGAYLSRNTPSKDPPAQTPAN